MFHNIRTKITIEIHNAPMDYRDNERIDSNDHILSEECSCSPTKWKKVLDAGKTVEEIYNHHRPDGEWIKI